MGLSYEEVLERKNDEHVKYITERIVNKDKEKPFVFISYKSDDWKIVLQDVVYRLVKDYGLNIYFDGDFDGHNPLWTTQFPENMESPFCKGVIAFIDNKYATSYATLLELMYSQGGCQNPITCKYEAKGVVPIFLEELTRIEDVSDTGLGQPFYEDGRKNVHYIAEQELFDDTLGTKPSSEIFEIGKRAYKKQKKLQKNICSVLVEELLRHIGKNNNFYKSGEDLDSIVNTIKDEFGGEVFRDDLSADDVVMDAVIETPAVSVADADEIADVITEMSTVSATDAVAEKEIGGAVKGGSRGKLNREEYWKSFVEYAFHKSGKAEFLKADFPVAPTSDLSWYALRLGSSKAHVELSFNSQKNTIRTALLIKDRSLLEALENALAETDLVNEVIVNRESKTANISVSMQEVDLISDSSRKTQFEWFMEKACAFKKLFEAVQK